MAFSGAGRWCLVVLVAVCAVLSGIPAFGAAYGVRAQCSPGYYLCADDDGACVQCTGHSVATEQRGNPIPTDEIVAADDLTATSVAISGDGDVVALGFAYAAFDNLPMVGIVRVYAWSGVAWVQRGDDIPGGSVGGKFAFTMALSGNGNVIAAAAPVVFGDDEASGAVFTFTWDGSVWSRMGTTFVGSRRFGSLGIALDLSALGTEVVFAEFFDLLGGETVSRTFVYEWSAGINDWALRGPPFLGSEADPSYGISAAMSSDGNVVAIGSTGPSADLVEGIVSVYKWVPDASLYELDGLPVVGGLGENFGGSQSIALSGDGNVLAVGVRGRGTNGALSGGVRVFGRVPEGFFPMGSIIEGAAAGDLAGPSVGLSEGGQVLVVPSRSSDSGRGSLAFYVWSSGGWEQRGDVLAGPLSDRQFGAYTALSGDGTVVVAASEVASGARVYNLTAEVGDVDDAVCQAAYGDNTAVYVASVGVCSGEGSVDVCEVPEGPVEPSLISMESSYVPPSGLPTNEPFAFVTRVSEAFDLTTVSVDYTVIDSSTGALLSDADVDRLFELQSHSGLIVRVAPNTLEAGQEYFIQVIVTLPGGESGTDFVQFSTAAA